MRDGSTLSTSMTGIRGALIRPPCSLGRSYRKSSRYTERKPDIQTFHRYGELLENRVTPVIASCPGAVKVIVAATDLGNAARLLKTSSRTARRKRHPLGIFTSVVFVVPSQGMRNPTKTRKVCESCGNPGAVTLYHPPVRRRSRQRGRISYRCQKCYFMSLLQRLRNVASLYSIGEARDSSGRHARTNHLRQRLRRRIDSILFADSVKAQRRLRRQVRGKDTIPIKDWEAIKKRYGYTCLCCGRREPEISLTQDHVIPIGSGGENKVGNIQPLCAQCNQRKGAGTTDYRASFNGKARGVTTSRKRTT
jgi:5-methylcytosine-specific restriction protein A